MQAAENESDIQSTSLIRKGRNKFKYELENEINHMMINSKVLMFNKYDSY